MSAILRVEGANLVAFSTVVDSNQVGVTAGQTVKFSIYDKVTGMYWDNGSGAFDSGVEILNDAGHIVDGIWQYVLVSGWNGSSKNFRVRRQLTGVVVLDYATEEFLPNIADIAGVTVSNGTVPANLVRVNGLASSDGGVSWSTIFEYMMGMFNGNFRKNFPNPGDLTWFKRNGTTPLSTVNLNDTERNRIL